MRFFTVKIDEGGSKKILYPFTAIAKISAELNPDFSSDFTKITLNNGEVVNVYESIDEVSDMLDDDNLKDEDFVLTAYRAKDKNLNANK